MTFKRCVDGSQKYACVVRGACTDFCDRRVRTVMTGDDMLLSGASAGDDIHFTSSTEIERNR